MGPPMVIGDGRTIRTEDYLHVKGVRLVEPGMPQWKIKPLQEKNIELINKYLQEEEAQKAEEARWAAMPEWKRKLMQEKEKKKKEEEEERRQVEAAEQSERDKFESLPEWKQNVIKKKRNSVVDSNSNSDTKSEASTGYPESQEENSLIQSQNSSTAEEMPEADETLAASSENNILTTDQDQSDDITENGS